MDVRYGGGVPATLLLGTQWGDEGKGKLTDLLAKDMQVVVRYQGGHNAGHRVVVDGEAFALQLLPSGVLYPYITPVIGNGVVVEPKVLLDEIDALQARGVDCSRLVISGSAHLVMPYHQEIDALTERYLGKNRLGTTKRGIGPAYADKAARIGLRAQDLLDPKIFRQKLDVVLKEKNLILAKIYNRLALSSEDIAKHYLEEYAPRLAPHIGDAVGPGARHAVRRGWGAPGRRAGDLPRRRPRHVPLRHVLQPGGRGGVHGRRYRPRYISRVVGIAKAYVTRVGAGPFPTEVSGEVGDTLVQRGKEFGTNTGRRRRPGWFDAVMMRHAVRLNSLDELAITKLDVLDSFETLKVCVAYEAAGIRYEHMPWHQSVLHEVRPVYEELPGWGTELRASTARRGSPARPALTSSSCLPNQACPSPMSASAPGATRSYGLPEMGHTWR